MLPQGHVGSPGHAVVLSVHIVEVARLLQDAAHGPNGALFFPIARLRGHQLHAGPGLDGVHKALVPLCGGRGALESAYLHHAAAAFELPGNELSHGLSYAIVVGSDKGSELVGVGFAVVENDGDAAVVGPFDGRGDGAVLVGGHDEQVHALVNEPLDLFHLPPAVVVGRGQAHLQRVVEVFAGFQLAVQLVAPHVLTALRHADDVFAGPLSVAAAEGQQREQAEEQPPRLPFHLSAADRAPLI